MVFFEQDWGNVYFGKNFLERESPTLSMIDSCKLEFNNFQW